MVRVQNHLVPRRDQKNAKEVTLFTSLLEGAFAAYGPGILPPEELKKNAANLTKKRELQKVIRPHP